MKKREVILVLFFILFLVSLYFDHQIMNVVSKIRNYFFTQLFLGFNFVSSVVIIFFFLTSLFLWNERKRRWIIPLWVSFLLSIIASFVLKILFRRLRPFELGFVFPNYSIEMFSSWNTSFPSFQSMVAFSALPLLDKEFPKFKYIWFLIACLIAFSRVYFSVHFLSDIIAGGIIGYLIGMFVIKIEQEKQLSKKIINKLKKKK